MLLQQAVVGVVAIAIVVVVVADVSNGAIQNERATIR